MKKHITIIRTAYIAPGQKYDTAIRWQCICGREIVSHYPAAEVAAIKREMRQNPREFYCNDCGGCYT